MAAVPVASLSVAESQELLVSYAALIFADSDAPITADNINKVLAAANAKVESYLPALFARFLSTTPVTELIASVGAAAGGAAPAAAAAGGAAAAVEEAAAPEEEEEAVEFDLF